jgi:orotidine-5'-phosphate decarboxylase
VTAQERLIVALDVAGEAEARRLVARLRGRVGMFKIGSQLFTAAGPGFVRELVSSGERVFLDLKFHDIPNTVAHAVESACGLGVALVDVHALAGPAAIRGAVQRLSGQTRLVAITILTSHDETTLASLGIAGPIADAVRRLALLARDAGADGVVASPQEAALVRDACGPEFLIVTPGIRSAGSSPGDQSRPASAAAARAAGADYLVVGRPITEANDPGAAADAIVHEIAQAG